MTRFNFLRVPFAPPLRVVEVDLDGSVVRVEAAWLVSRVAVLPAALPEHFVALVSSKEVYVVTAVLWRVSLRKGGIFPSLQLLKRLSLVTSPRVLAVSGNKVDRVCVPAWWHSAVIPVLFLFHLRLQVHVLPDLVHDLGVLNLHHLLLINYHRRLRLRLVVGILVGVLVGVDRLCLARVLGVLGGTFRVVRVALKVINLVHLFAIEVRCLLHRVEVVNWNLAVVPVVHTVLGRKHLLLLRVHHCVGLQLVDRDCYELGLVWHGHRLGDVLVVVRRLGLLYKLRPLVHAVFFV